MVACLGNAPTTTGNTILLDRDGVINHDSPAYIKGWDEVVFIPHSLEAIGKLAAHGYAVIIVTNQSGIGRGLLSLQTLIDIHSRMAAQIRAHRGNLLDILFCPHLPDEGCECRKPKPGLILQAANQYHLELQRTFLIGDRVSDIECARNAGCGGSLLVRTGNGCEAEKELARRQALPDHVAADLDQAVDWILQHPFPADNPRF